MDKLTGSAYMLASLTDSLRLYDGFDRLSFSEQYHITSMMMTIIENGGFNTKMDIDKLVKNTKSIPCSNIITLYGKMSDSAKFKELPISDRLIKLITVYSSISDYRDNICRKSGYTDKYSLNYDRMVTRYIAEINEFDTINSVRDVLELMENIKLESEQVVPLEQGEKCDECDVLKVVTSSGLSICMSCNNF